MLEGLLSIGAGALYDSLIRNGPVPLEDPRASSAEMDELLDKGFVRRDYRREPSIRPVEPTRAVDHAILRQQLDLLQAAHQAADGAGATSAVEVLTDPKRIGELSVELCRSARQDFLTFTTRHVQQAPAAAAQRGVVLRNVCERAVLDVQSAQAGITASLAAGWQLRVASELPMRMVIADQHSALVPLDPGGREGTLLVRAPIMVAALRMLFELVWAQAVPLCEQPPGVRNGLTPTQARVLGLLATGMTDGAIARYLEVSERTVRRHVSALLEALQADNRVAAVYAATRLGWLN